MRPLPIIALSILTVAPAGVAVASVPPTLPEPPPESVSVPEVSLATPDTTQAPDNAVRVVDDTGDSMASIAVESAEPAWTGYADGDEPDGGNEYLRVVVTVQNN